MIKTIMTRKSIRTFDKKPVSDIDKQKVCSYMENIDNPYGIKVKFVWLDAKEHGLSSPVIKGESAYIAATVPNVEHCEEAFGYSFEKLVLFAWSLGLGTTWIGGTMNRKNFEKAANVKEGELMMCVTPIGYPADKKSFIDKNLRKQVGGDKRLAASELFFENDFNPPIQAEDEILETVRWAPSAANMQPCRIVKINNKYHFYEKQSPMYKGRAGWDVQKVDIGIAICHLMSVIDGQFEINNPNIAVKDGAEYIATVIA